MSASGRVDAIQAAVIKAAKAAAAEYQKRNLSPEGKAVNKPPRSYVEKIIRSRLEKSELVEAFVADALAAVGE